MVSINARLRTRLGAPLAGALHLSGGSIVSQLMVFATTLLIARLYTPADLGLLSAVMAVAMTVYTMITLGLQVMIVPAKTDADAVRLAQLALASTLAGVVISAILLAFIPLPSPQLSEERWVVNAFVPLMLMALGSYAVLSQLSLRQRLYGAIALRGVSQSATTGVVQVGGFLVHQTSLWLLAGELLGRTIGTLSLVPQAWRFYRSLPGRLPPPFAVLNRYGDAIRFYLPATACEMAAAQVVVLLIAVWYGPSEAGYLGLANRVLTVPAAFVGAAIAQVLATELARSRDAGRVRQALPRLRRVALGLLSMGAIFATSIFILGPWAFSLAFGDQWRDAGELARYLSIPIVVTLVWSPISVVFATFYRLRIFMLIAIVRLPSTLAAALLSHYLGYDWMVTAVGMSCANASVEVAGLWLAWRIVSHEAAAEEPSRL